MLTIFSLLFSSYAMTRDALHIDSVLRCDASVALALVTGAFLSVLQMSAALNAPLQLHALLAGTSLQSTHAHLKQLQQWNQNGAASAASPLGSLSPVKGNAGTWHTAQLSVARSGLSATSLPSQGLAVFAGGYGALLRK